MEIFYGEGGNKRIALSQEDALIFPSFIMHRAPREERDTHWTLVPWLTGQMADVITYIVSLREPP
jgi:hypothetical protein